MTAVRRLWPYAPALAVLVSEWRLLWPMPALVDHFQFWIAGHAIASGQSPYDRSTWEAAAAMGPVPGGIAVSTVLDPSATWPYPPQTAFLFAPFGAVPLDQGVPALQAFVLVAAAGGLVLAARLLRLDGVCLAWVLILSVLSQPFVVGVRSGHPIGLALTAILLIFVGLRDRRLWLLCSGVVLVSLTPQLAIASGVAVGAVLFGRRDVRALAAVSVALLLVTVAADLWTPFPLGQLLGSGGRRLGFDLSTTWALARDLGGGAPLAVVLIVVAVASVVAAVRLAPVERRSMLWLGGLLSLTVASTPYAHDYDMLLIIPAAFVVVALTWERRLWAVVMALLLIGVLPWILFLWWPLQGQPDRIYQGGALGALALLAAAAFPLAASVARARSRRDSQA